MIYAQILDIINQNVKKNGREEITGNILNSVLRALLDFINSQNKSFNGVLTTQTKPNNITKGFWFATEGVYPYFGVSVPENNLGIIYWENGYKVDLIDLVDEQALKDYIDQQLVNINLGFGGEITSLIQSPTIDGMYLPKIIGVYPNFGNLEYLESDGFVVFLYKDGVFSKVNIPLDINIENNVNYNSNNVVSGSAVEKYSLKKVNTVAELRNTEGEYEGQIISLLGYYESGDKESLSYKYQNTQLIDDGGSVINNIFGSWCICEYNEVNVVDFGVKRDGVTDDSTLYQKAINYAILNNKNIVLHQGISVLNNDLVFDFSKNMSNKRTNTKGFGIDNTKFFSKNENSICALKFKANHGYFVDIKGFSVYRVDNGAPSGGVGIEFNSFVYLTAENIDTFRFDIGIRVVDIATGYFKNVNGRWGNHGVYGLMEVGGFTNPNLLNFQNCIFNSNTKWGAFFLNGHNVNLFSCCIEGNELGGVYGTYNGSNGKVGYNIENSYFEGNKGNADIYITMHEGGSCYLKGNTYNRLSTNSTTHNVVIDVSDMNGKTDEVFITSESNGYWSTFSDTNKKAVNIVGITNYNNLTYIDKDYYSNDSIKPILNKKVNYNNIDKEPVVIGLVLKDGLFSNVKGIENVSIFSDGIYLVTTTRPLKYNNVIIATPNISDGSEVLKITAFKLNETTVQVNVANNANENKRSDFSIVVYAND